MQIKYLIPIFLVAGALLIGMFGFQSPGKLKFMNYDDYQQSWKTIDSLEYQGLIRSALEEVESLLTRAKTEANAPQTYKALLYKSKYASQLEEDGFANAIDNLEAELETLPSPTKEVLQSQIGKLYETYLANQYWTIRDRTSTGAFKSDDIKTWTVDQLLNRSQELFLASIQNKALQSLPAKDFDAILTPGYDTEELRPTLYDVLAHRCIQYLTNERSYLNQPAYQFYLDQAAAFAPVEKFVETKFETQDSAAMKYNTLLVFQDLLSFRLKDKNKAALLDADRFRLQFVYQNSVHPDKDALYLKALEKGKTYYAGASNEADLWALEAQYYFSKGRSYQRVAKGEEDPKRWYLKKSHELSQAVLEKFKTENWGTQICAQLIQQIESPEFSISVEEVNLPSKPALMRINYKNTSGLHFKLSRLDDKRRTQLDKINNSDYDKKRQFFNDLPAQRRWEVELPEETDFHQHSTESLIGPLSPGQYLLVVGDKEDFSAQSNAGYLIFNVSNLGYWNRMDNEEKQEFVVFDRTTGQPKSGVKAEFFERKYNSIKRSYDFKKIYSTTSDVNGFIKTDIGGERKYFRLKLNEGEDTLFLGNGYTSHYNRYRKNKTYNTHFFTDRAIYRPGQTIYFKGLLIETDEESMPEILPYENVSVTFYDANYQEVTKLDLKTNEYGTFSGTFIAPTSGLLGSMRMVSSKGGEKRIRVEEYKRPKFEVTFPQIDEAYSLNDELEIKGTAKAYAGNAIDGASVKYRVVRQARFPWLPWWYYRWGNPWNTSPTEIAQGVVDTDEKGEFVVPFTALPDRSIPEDKLPEFSYTIYVDVTDISGETRTGQTNVSVGYVALRASLDLPDMIHADSLKKITIQTTNLNGGFEAASGTLKLSLLKQPNQLFVDRRWDSPDRYILEEKDFRKFFPHIAYEEENEPQNWQNDRTILEDPFDTGASKEVMLGKVKIVPGVYKATLNTMDKAGKKVSLEKIITVFDLEAKKIPVKRIGWAYTKNKAYEPDETASVYVGSSLSDQPVLFEMERDGEILYSKWMTRDDLKAIDYKIEAQDRGNVHYLLNYAGLNRSFQDNGTFSVPWSNKVLEIEYTTFRDKLLPGQDEEWQIKIKGPKGDKIAAEMVAAMYDASLDAFAPNYWGFNVFPYNYSRRGWNRNGEYVAGENRYDYYYPVSVTVRQPVYQELEVFGFYGYGYYSEAYTTRSYGGGGAHRRRAMAKNADADMAAAPPPPPPVPTAESVPQDYAADAAPMDGIAVEESEAVQNELNDPGGEQGADKEGNFNDVPVRTNLNETVFFYPHLSTDEEGNILVKFKMNEALTKWNFFTFAHTKDLVSRVSTKEIVTQKDLMVVPNPPRFYRESDEIEFTSKVVNMTEKTLTGSAVLQLVNPLNEQPIYDWKENSDFDRTFVIEGNQSVVLSWRFDIPDLAEVPVIQHTVFAKAGNQSDAERAAAPVVSNRMLVTETMPLPLKGNETKTFTMERLTKVKSPTLSHHNVTLEFTSNPAWYAVQALPYLMEYPYECTEQIFSRYYANSLATTVANAHPKIKTVFEQWKGTDALESNLTKNQELKSALLEETPWVLNAQSESDQKKQIALLFDLNRMAQEQAVALQTLESRQLPNGGFSWFPGYRDNWYITQYLVEGLGHLHQLGVTDVQENPSTWRMVRNAVSYIDDRMVEEYERLEKLVKEGKAEWEDDHLTSLAIHYLYTRSFFLQDRSAQADRSGSLKKDFDPQYLPLSGKIEKVVQYYLTQSEVYWTRKGIYMQGMIGLYSHRMNKATLANKVVASLGERALHNEELGMYWKYNRGYFWNELPIETHSLMIELFEEVAQDADAVYELKVWLLKNKQTNHWKTTKATASAVYALLMSGDNWLLEDQPLEITLGKRKDEIAAEWQAQIVQAQKGAEAGTGYFKTSFVAKDIDPTMGQVKVKNPNSGIAWGGLYWQYFEDLDKITSFEETPLELKKQLYRVDLNDRGEVLTPIAEGASLNPGDKLMVRIELRVDRPMEYVHMKDMRASGFEPINVLSGYKWKGGLGFYESTRDVSTNFFFNYLPKGTHVFEYPLRVVHKGDFSNGITTIQCMYAPEFTSHSEGIRVTVE